MNKITLFLVRCKIKRLRQAREHIEHQIKLHHLSLIDIDDEIRRFEFLELIVRIDTK